jgi:triacylglycerol lipase
LFATLDGFKDWLLTNARNFLIIPGGQMGTDYAAAEVEARFHSGFTGAIVDI